MALTDKVSNEEFRRIWWKHGPRLNMIYVRPTTPDEHAANEMEYRAAVKRVRKFICDNYSEVKPDVPNETT